MLLPSKRSTTHLGRNYVRTNTILKYKKQMPSYDGNKGAKHHAIPYAYWTTSRDICLPFEATIKASLDIRCGLFTSNGYVIP